MLGCTVLLCGEQNAGVQAEMLFRTIAKNTKAANVVRFLSPVFFPVIPRHTILVGKSRCIVGGNVRARGNSLHSTPKTVQISPRMAALPHKHSLKSLKSQPLYRLLLRLPVPDVV